MTKVSASQELLESAVCEPAELKRQAALFSQSDLIRFFHSLAETETKLRTATQPRYQLEVGIVKLMQLRDVEKIPELLDRLSALESSLDQKGFSVPGKSSSGGGSMSGTDPQTRKPISGQRSAGSSFAATAASPALEERSDVSANAYELASFKSESVGGEMVSPAQLPAHAPVIDKIKTVLESRRKMFLVTVLEAAHSTIVAEGELCVEFKPEARHFRDTLSKPENAKLLRAACQEATGKEMGVRISIAEPQTEPVPISREDEERLEQQRLRESAEKNPIVQQMLRTFRGEIVNVRPLQK